jgi:hypothetical protein
MKGKINELATNSKYKNIRDLYRGINEFKRGYRPRSNFGQNLEIKIGNRSLEHGL